SSNSDTSPSDSPAPNTSSTCSCPSPFARYVRTRPSMIRYSPQHCSPSRKSVSPRLTERHTDRSTSALHSALDNDENSDCPATTATGSCLHLLIRPPFFVACRRNVTRVTDAGRRRG